MSEKMVVGEWQGTSYGTTQVVLVNPAVARITQMTLVTGGPASIWLTEDEWLRVGRAMGWTVPTL